MNRDEVWKNFDLGKELDISGAFIFNGLRAFHEMQTLDRTEEIFECLYNLSVGLERLLKVGVVLLEHSSEGDQQRFEQSLITHNHLELVARVRERVTLPLQGPHNEFLGLLGTFYRSFRYDRFSKSLQWSPDKERKALCAYLSKHLSVSFHVDGYLANTNDIRYKRFIGNVVSKIAGSVYEVVVDRARALNLYTWERRVDSKAAKVFDGRSFTFDSEDVLIKELLVFFMNTPTTSGLIDHIRSIPPLEFDPALAQDYFACFGSEEAKQQVLGELEALYDDLDDKKVRLDMLSPIGDGTVVFWSDLDGEDWDDDEEPHNS